MLQIYYCYTATNTSKQTLQTESNSKLAVRILPVELSESSIYYFLEIILLPICSEVVSNLLPRMKQTNSVAVLANGATTNKRDFIKNRVSGEEQRKKS